MTSYCTGKLKGNVDINLGGSIYKVTVTQQRLPLTIETNIIPIAGLWKVTVRSFLSEIETTPRIDTFEGVLAPFKVLLSDQFRDQFSDSWILVSNPIPAEDYVWRFNYYEAQQNLYYQRYAPNRPVIIGVEPQVNATKLCQIIVKDKQGIVVFDKTGNCPLNYTVTCDEDCPEGHCKCDTIEYPGYCCLPCSQVAKKLLVVARNIL